jgi:GH3 auxin-responsive promoter
VISVLRASLALREWAHAARFQRATERPDQAQRAVLQALVRTNADTAFGRDHGFASITTPAEYARRVPIRDYESVRPYVSRIVAREDRILTAEPPRIFTTTSGTTGEPKLIPVTASWRAQMARLTRLWMLHAARDHPATFAGKALTLVSPALEGVTAGGLPFGAMSGVMYENLPWLVRRHYAVPYAACLVPDCDARYFVTLRLALAHSISVIGTPNATSLLRLAETAAGRAEELVRAVHDGTLGLPAAATGLGVGTLLALEAGLRPDPAQARALAAIVERHGVLAPRYCWPDLALIACWLGGSAGHHARRLAEHYGDVPLRDLGLLASEGRMTIPLEDGSAEGVLAVHASFFEFIPEDRIESPSPPVLLAHDLEEGHRYYLILSGGNGLYRYDMNDVVQVRGFHGRTPRLAFVRKGRDMVSITGEKLHLNQVQAAVREAEDQTKLDVWQFRLVPDVEGRRYDLLVEPRGALADAQGLAFLEAFDQALARLNVEYASKRASKRLGPPRLAVMRPGWSERECRADFQAGKRELQHKWPVMRLEWDVASRQAVLRTLERP